MVTGPIMIINLAAIVENTLSEKSDIKSLSVTWSRWTEKSIIGPACFLMLDLGLWKRKAMLLLLLLLLKVFRLGNPEFSVLKRDFLFTEESHDHHPERMNPQCEHMEKTQRYFSLHPQDAAHNGDTTRSEVTGLFFSFFFFGGSSQDFLLTASVSEPHWRNCR